MDIKIDGHHLRDHEEATRAGRDGRLHILDKMAEAMPPPREELSEYAPRITAMKINPEKIGALIGPGGKTIRSIQEETGTKIDIQDDGTISIASTDPIGAGSGARLSGFAVSHAGDQHREG